MPLVRCPICRKQFDSDQSTALPFCGERCRRIDLGRWLGEDYSVPIERSDEDPDDEYREEDSR
ncbi:MAG TPA: DNA gyrase inhibitor YacG [Pirellulales bacterium]|nr:DNA gyrase inhibitor YacG [Pirellulales bacterium]